MTRYELFRKRIAPIAFFLAIGLIVRDSCQKEQRTHSAIELTFGAQKPRVRAVDVDVVVGGQILATFRRAAMPGAMIGPCRFPASLPDEDGELEIDVDLGGAHQQLTKHFRAIEGGTVVISISDDDLPAPPAQPATQPPASTRSPS
ncbi:MAG TPA: hypothetical protein VGC42_32650 [Kofleriaceae bacterium]